MRINHIFKNEIALIAFPPLVATQKNARSTHFALTSFLAFIYLFAAPLIKADHNFLFQNPFYWLFNILMMFALGGPVFGWLAYLLNQQGFCNKRMFALGLVFQVFAFSLIYYFQFNVNWIWAMMALGTLGILLPVFLYYRGKRRESLNQSDPVSHLFRYYYALILMGVFVVYLGTALKWVSALS